MQERADRIRSLMESHVGFFLLDGSQYREQGLRYVCYILEQFKNEIRRIKDDLVSDGNPMNALPQQWVICISKSDLLPEGTTAEMVARDIVAGAYEQLAGLARALGTNAFGHQYLLLSSVKGVDNRVLDAHDY
ncbi:MAG: hypothetical protein ACREOH_05925, partial [Candidatus Entotheonellia bacterium]